MQNLFLELSSLRSQLWETLDSDSSKISQASWWFEEKMPISSLHTNEQSPSRRSMRFANIPIFQCSNIPWSFDNPKRS
jgi:hypothetical protein